MKTSLFFFGFVASQIIQMHAAVIPEVTFKSTKNINVISSNQVFVDIMNEHLTTAYSQAHPDQTLTRKKNIASTLLNGLAHVCMHLGSIFGASNKQEKHQGMFNVAGTVLSVASELASHSEKQPKPASPSELAYPATDNVQKEQMAAKLADLTTSLIDAIEAEPLKNPMVLPDTLALIRSVPNLEERQALIQTLLATPEQAKQYLTELFTTVYNYASINGSALVEYIREKIAHYLDAKASTTLQPNTQGECKAVKLKSNVLESGSILYADIPQKYTTVHLDYLTAHFVSILQNKLTLIISADQPATTQHIVNSL